MASKNPARPNILFILSDDQGAWAMRCAGNEEMITPNLDRLSATGIRFDNFFCASPVCSPARASILTGRIPSQHGVQDFLRAGNAAFLPGDGLEIDYIAGQPTYIELAGAERLRVRSERQVAHRARRIAASRLFVLECACRRWRALLRSADDTERGTLPARRVCYGCHNRQRAGISERAGWL